MTTKIKTIGIAIGIGAGKPGTKDSPKVIQNSHFLPTNVDWKETIVAADAVSPQEKFDSILNADTKLAQSVAATVREKGFFLVVGGDHSCAMGTWSGVSEALNDDFGLIWIDAHCDAHTHESSHTGNIHGMPVAALLGFGEDKLTQISHPKRKLKPENLVLIGIRDYENEEHELLLSLGVKIFYNTDVHAQGIGPVFKQALEHVRSRTNHYGLSFDLDGLDPKDIPAVGTPVVNGISAAECMSELKQFSNDPQLIGYEIVEFNPNLDKEQVTEKYLCDIIRTIQPGV